MSKLKEQQAARASVDAELAALARKHRGVLAPATVVEFAKSARTALHTHFVWDDTEAGRRYRLIQAGMLIRLKVTILQNAAGEHVKVPQYVPFTKGGNVTYRAVEHVLSSDKLREEAELQMRKQVEAILRVQKAWAQVSPLYQRLEAAVAGEPTPA